VKIAKVNVVGGALQDEIQKEVAMLSAVQGHPHILQFH